MTGAALGVGLVLLAPSKAGSWPGATPVMLARGAQ